MERILLDYCLKKVMQLSALLAMRWQPRLIVAPFGYSEPSGNCVHGRQRFPKRSAYS